jgi:hypothetical protein
MIATSTPQSTCLTASRGVFSSFQFFSQSCNLDSLSPAPFQRAMGLS